MDVGEALLEELIDAGWTTAWNTAEGMNSDEAEKAEEAEEVIDDEALEEAGL